MSDLRDFTGKNRKFTGTTGLKIASGTAAQRVDEAGRFRFNTDVIFPIGSLPKKDNTVIFSFNKLLLSSKKLNSSTSFTLVFTISKGL